MLDSSRQTVRMLTLVLGALALSIARAACGGSATRSSSTSTTSAAATTTTPGGTLRGESHAPKVDRDWRYWVTVTPAAAVGNRLSVRAVIHTRLGSVTLDWPITVRQ